MSIFNKSKNDNLIYRSDIRNGDDVIYEVKDAVLVSSQALLGLTYKMGDKIGTRDEFISAFKVNNKIIYSLNRRVYCEVAGLDGYKFTVKVKVINLGKLNQTETIIGVIK